MMLRRMTLRRKTDPKTGTPTVCEPAQSKCISTFRKSHFIRKFGGKMLETRVSMLIKHRLWRFRKNPSVWTHCLGKNLKTNPNRNPKMNPSCKLPCSMSSSSTEMLQSPWCMRGSLKNAANTVDMAAFSSKMPHKAPTFCKFHGTWNART